MSVVLGQYKLEVTCPGYRKASEEYSWMARRENEPLYIYMLPESAPAATPTHARTAVLSQQLRGSMDRGLAALRQSKYESARKIFAKVEQKAPNNTDAPYFMGVAEYKMQHLDAAREDYQHALTLDPNNEQALLSLGELDRQSGKPAEAVVSLEKAVSLGRAGWKANFELASVYYELKRYGDAEVEVAAAIRHAKGASAGPVFLLGQIQFAEGKRAVAKRTWQSILQSFPKDPLVEQVNKALELVANAGPEGDLSSVPTPPTPAREPAMDLDAFVDIPWAPPDTDDAVYALAPGVDCKAETILDRATQRMNSGLADFEKFAATEHIEHQSVDRYGLPGSMKSHDSPYVVFVNPLGKTSYFLEEYREQGSMPTGFTDEVVSTGLITLGVSVLQPFYRDRFSFSCEGLANVRGQAAWQVRFEEKRDAKGPGIRTWETQKATYQIPVKGRVWLANATYAVLRVETDLRDPIAGLELTKDHILVEYGPVDFTGGDVHLWLPWSADMYMELHGKRYHHKHFLSNYMLFGVDTTHKVSAPKAPAPPVVNAP
ncbi:MAG TPA: tetratricopeptide repeat protein [Candidatus Dormibacteraeota bacterium]|nr:tetratricopeptide repeat protein [Candidatus Dormibacteraeota bacterium]